MNCCLLLNFSILNIFLYFYSYKNSLHKFITQYFSLSLKRCFIIKKKHFKFYIFLRWYIIKCPKDRYVWEEMMSLLKTLEYAVRPLWGSAVNFLTKLIPRHLSHTQHYQVFSRDRAPHLLQELNTKFLSGSNWNLSDEHRNKS